MEIFIRLAGIQLGPYTQEQVQQHLTDGLLSLTDLAKREGMEDWAPLSEVLARVPAPVEVAPEPAPDATPAPDTAELPAAIKTEETPEATRRAPDAPPGVRHLPTRLQELPGGPATEDDITDSKKTVLLGPSAPIRASSIAPSSTSIVTTTPLTQSKATKQGARAALVKALAQGTSPLPTKAINAPPRPPVASPVVAAPPVPRKTPSPPLVEDLGVKTVPMRSTPAAPPLPAMMPSTMPLNSRMIQKPPTGAVVPASAPVAPVPPDPTTKSKATPPPEPPPDFEVATVKVPPPVFRREEKPAVKPPEPMAKQPVEKPVAPPVETMPPAPRRRLLPKIMLAWAALAVFMLYYVWSPYHAVASLRTALEGGDVAGLDAAVDFALVRDGLKAQMKNEVGANGEVVLPMLDRSVDAYVTPEGISGLTTKLDAVQVDDQKQNEQLISREAAAKILVALKTQPVRNEGLASFGDFVLDEGAVILHLKFNGMGWKLKGVELRPDLAAPLIAPVVDTFMQRGIAQARSGDAKGAAADFTQVIAIDPRSSAAYNERGNVRAGQGDLDGAIADYSQAVTIDPSLAAAYNGRGNAKASKNDEDGAITDYTQAIRLDPSLAAAYDSRGNAKLSRSDDDGAIADFTQAIVIDPNLASAYSDRGFARQANGNLEGAIADYTQALALKPKTARTYFNRGMARQAQGNLDAAIVDFDHALAFDPKLANAYYYRGNAKSANHDLDGAIADYTQAVTLDPKIAQAYGNRGLARQAQGDVDGAAADFTQALALDPKNGSAYLNRALIEAQKNELDAAIADSTQALYLDAKNAQAYGTRGFAKLTKGNLDGALADLKQFCELAPRDHNADHARLYLWLISKAQNSGADADADLSAAMESSWNSAPEDLLTKTGSFFLNRMNEADYLAAAASSDAKIDQAQHCQAWYFVGMKRLLMADKKGAIEAFHQCLATQQKDFCEYVLAQTELQALEMGAPVAPSPAPAAAKPNPAKPAPVAPPKKP